MNIALKRMPSHDEIAEAVCLVFEITHEQLNSDTRFNSGIIFWGRCAYAYFCAVVLNESCCLTAKHLGLKAHSTIINRKRQWIYARQGQAAQVWPAHFDEPRYIELMFFVKLFEIVEAAE